MRASKLRGKVSARIEDLDEQHERHAFLPSSLTCRPRAEIAESKARFVREELPKWASSVDFFAATVFGAERLAGPDGLLRAAAGWRDRRPAFVLQAQRFPYDVQAHHYVLWWSRGAGTPDTAHNASLPDGFVTALLEKLLANCPSATPIPPSLQRPSPHAHSSYVARERRGCP